MELIWKYKSAQDFFSYYTKTPKYSMYVITNAINQQHIYPAPHTHMTSFTNAIQRLAMQKVTGFSILAMNETKQCQEQLHW